MTIKPAVEDTEVVRAAQARLRIQMANRSPDAVHQPVARPRSWTVQPHLSTTKRGSAESITIGPLTFLKSLHPRFLFPRSRLSRR